MGRVGEAQFTGIGDEARQGGPAVVNIYTRSFAGNRGEKAELRPQGLGSGVIMNQRGHVLTNYHVIADADQIIVALQDGRVFSAELVGTDKLTDLAVLYIESDNLPVIPQDPDRLPDVGDVVLAIGNPYNVGQTITQGIISATGRIGLSSMGPDSNGRQDLLQTDAAINPGNSGGALVDSHGNLVGINTAIYSRTGGSLGIGFAIPVSSARSIMEQIIRTGTVTRGWIGVEAQEITAELAESFGLPDTEGSLIAGVVRGSPADSAGVRPGDVLLSVNGKPVKDPQVMLDLIAALAPEERAAFRLRRDKTIVEVQVRIGKRPAMRAERE
jgi:serine peptidase DegS